MNINEECSPGNRALRCNFGEDVEPPISVHRAGDPLDSLCHVPICHQLGYDGIMIAAYKIKHWSDMETVSAIYKLELQTRFFKI